MSGPRQRKNQPGPLKSAISAEEQAVFQAAVADATPLPPPNKVFPSAKPVSPRPRKTRDDDAFTTADFLSDHDPFEGDDVADLSFQRPGMPSQTLRKLRRGHWTAQAQLDLHGMTSNEARQAVVQFIGECRQFDIRCVRIVHGKGLSSANSTPVLKRKLRNWLTQIPQVLAFCQARSAEGGGGAVIVLLKAAD